MRIGSVAIARVVVVAITPSINLCFSLVCHYSGKSNHEKKWCSCCGNQWCSLFKAIHFVGIGLIGFFPREYTIATLLPHSSTISGVFDENFLNPPFQGTASASPSKLSTLLFLGLLRLAPICSGGDAVQRAKHALLCPMKKGKVPPLPAFDAVSGDASRLSTSSAWFTSLQMASAESLIAGTHRGRLEHAYCQRCG